LAEFERVKQANAEAEIVAKMKADREKQAESEATTLAEADALAEFERVKQANAEAEIVAKMKADREKQAESEATILAEADALAWIESVNTIPDNVGSSSTSKIVLSNKELSMSGAPEGELFVAEVFKREDLVPFGPSEDPDVVLQVALNSLTKEVCTHVCFCFYLVEWYRSCSCLNTTCRFTAHPVPFHVR